jgi:hypothetical protein
MEQTFWFWRYHQLWKIILELYQNNKCDGVLAFLPNIYNNVAYVEGIPWEQHQIDDIWGFTNEILRLSLNSTTITKERSNTNITTCIEK